MTSTQTHSDRWEDQPSPPGSDLFVGLSLACIAAATIIVEISLTKFIGYKLFYHFTYAVISLVMYSFGLAGITVFMRPNSFGADKAGHWWSAARYSWFFACSLPLAIVIFCILPLVNFGTMLPAPVRVILFVVAAVILALPFYLSGVTISHILSASRIRVSTLYALDLIAAAAGAIVTPLLLEQFGGYGTMFVAALLGAVGAFLLAKAAKVPGRFRQLPLILVFAVCASALFVMPKAYLSILGTDILSFKDPAGGNFFRLFGGGLERTYWNAIARVDVTKTSPVRYSGLAYGLSSKIDRSKLVGRYMLVDGSANTRQIKQDTPEQSQLYLGTNMFAAPYVVRAHTDKTMIIGGGGGIDIEIAKLFKIPSIDVIEMNPSTYKMLSGTADDPEKATYLPPLQSNKDSNVTVFFDEARHFCSRKGPDTYDVIHAGGVDTLAAVASGGMSLTENYLYTTDAIKIYYQMLKSDGVLSLSHWRRIPPHIGLRLFCTYLNVLQDEGVKEPWRQVMSIGGDWTVNLQKRTIHARGSSPSSKMGRGKRLRRLV